MKDDTGKEFWGGPSISKSSSTERSLIDGRAVRYILEGPEEGIGGQFNATPFSNNKEKVKEILTTMRL